MSLRRLWDYGHLKTWPSDGPCYQRSGPWERMPIQALCAYGWRARYKSRASILRKYPCKIQRIQIPPQTPTFDKSFSSRLILQGPINKEGEEQYLFARYMPDEIARAKRLKRGPNPERPCRFCRKNFARKEAADRHERDTCKFLGAPHHECNEDCFIPCLGKQPYEKAPGKPLGRKKWRYPHVPPNFVSFYLRGYFFIKFYFSLSNFNSIFQL